MAEKIEFDIVTGKDTLGKSLDDAKKKAVSLEGALSTALGVFAGGVALKGIEAITGAIGDLNRFAKESIKAFSEQEDALNRLGQALRASGDFSQAALSDLSAYATELQKTSKFGDELVISQLAIAKSFGATNKVSKELVTAAANLSATFGGSLEENVQKLGKTLAGEAGRLTQFVPELKSLTDAQLKAGAAADIINSKFGGAAASELNTYSGSVIAAKNAFSDLQEEFGGLIVGTLNLQGKNALLKDVYELLTRAVSDYNIESQRQNGSLTENEASVEQLRRKLDDLKVAAIDAGQIISNPSLFDTLLARPLAAAENIKLLNTEIAATSTELLKAQNSVDAEFFKNLSQGSGNQEQADNLTKQQIDAVALKNSQIAALDRELALEQAKIQTDSFNLFIADSDIQKQAILDSEFQFQLDKNQVILDQQIAANEQLATEQEKSAANSIAIKNKELNDLKLAGKFQLDTDKLKIASDKATTQAKIENLQRVASVTSQVGNLATSLAKEGSTAQFVISKAFALGQIAIARATGIANALFLTPAAQPAAIAFANITAGIAAAQVAASSIKFEQGGFVGGSNGATSGADNVSATVRTGELILNGEQQKNLLSLINNGSSEKGDIVIQVDGKEIARAVRNQVRSGFQLGS